MSTASATQRSSKSWPSATGSTSTCSADLLELYGAGGGVAAEMGGGDVTMSGPRDDGALERGDTLLRAVSRR